MPHTCQNANRGIKIKEIKSTVWNKWRDIAHEQVDHYVCPACGATQTYVETHGTSVSRQRYAVLAAL